MMTSLPRASQRADPCQHGLARADELDVVVGAGAAGQIADPFRHVLVALAAWEHDGLGGADLLGRRGFCFRVGDRDRARPGRVRNLDRHQPYSAHAVHDDRVAERDAGEPRGVDDGHPAAGEERSGLEGDGVR